MQDHSNPSIKERGQNTKKPFVSTRHRDAEPDNYDPNQPRLGRRESEPHSAEITYLYDVLTTNFPSDRTMWDLHHYFKKEGEKFDIQFDISYFKNLKIPYTLSSYDAEKFDGRVPTAAINILSPSTWRSDLAEKLDYCRILEIPLYIVFPSYHVATNLYKPPFVRAYVLKKNGEYKIHELREVTVDSSGEWNPDAIIDVSSAVPFRIGLQQREKKHQGDETLYRLILIDSDEDVTLLTEIDKKNQKLKEQDEKLKEQDEKLKEQDEKLNEQRQKIEILESEIQKLKEKLKD
ncbi:MAG: hypothetical protein ACOC35_12760 [Promethearchaeia archaeon]